ncbi:MAG: hypothetical protein AAFY42_08305 [Pseudomonadota bacterium]
MTSPSQSFWQTAYVLRSQARQKRADAARVGAELIENAAELPGDATQRLRDILDNLDDPETADKAQELSDSVREEWDRAMAQARETLGSNPSQEAIDLVFPRLLRFLDDWRKIRQIARDLDEARHLDIVARSMLEMGDFALDQGL